jgi:acid phosphatase
MPFVRSLLASVLLLTLSACAATMQPRAEAIPEGTPAAGELATSHEGVGGDAAGPAPSRSRANDSLNAVAWMQDSVEFRLISGQTWRAALGQLDRAIKTPTWDALPREERSGTLEGLGLAVIVDIDETVLDNSPYQARLVRDDSEFDPVAWSRWVDERAARPVPGALEFARAANARGVTLFYISNRAANMAAATLANLRAAGFPVASDAQYLGVGTEVPGCVSQGSDKACRRQLVSRTHRVLLMVGDQIGDFVSVASNTPQGREAAVRPYLSWVGERWFVLPNPSYGSWEDATFGNDRTLPREVRRQRKLDGLRY